MPKIFDINSCALYFLTSQRGLENYVLSFINLDAVYVCIYYI